MHVLVELEGREDDDARRRRRIRGHDPARRLDPVHLGHLDVHEHDVGPRVLDERDARGAVGGLPHHLDAGIRAEERDEAAPHEVLVVDHRDTDHASLSSYGSHAATSKPPPMRGPAFSVPPCTATRSRMPTRPWPPPAVLFVEPLPSSLIATRTPSGS